MRLFLFVSLSILTCITASAQLQPVTFKNDPIGLKQYQLKNGLTVFLSENHDIPQVFGAVVVKTGGKKDPADNTGMAHYLEHMLFKGTEELGTTNYVQEKIHLDEINRLYDELGKTRDPLQRKIIQKKINDESVKAAQYAIPNEMDRMLSEIGSDDVNAFTTEEITAYFNTFPPNQIRRWLEIYDHRFEKPVFRLFQSELETVYEEKNRGMDNPIEFVLEKYMQKFYKVHPYGQQTVIGKTEHLKNPSLTAMYNYFNTYYVANNMALILSGDFKSEEVIRIIEEKFSDWRSAPIPEFPNYREEDFKGRELVKMRATPVKAGAIGFRVPAKNANDETEVEVLLNMLSNESAGPLDRLKREGKLLECGAFPLINDDYGAAIFFFIPKLVGQSLKKAERVIRAEISNIKKGEFDERLLEATKISLIKYFQQNWERNESRVLSIGTAFSSGTSWSEFLSYESKIRAVNKDDIVRVANKYLGENSLVLHSKMGRPDKEKLEKPGFEPVIPKEELQSDYYKKWKTIPEDEAITRFVDFEKDIKEYKLGDKTTLYQSTNPYNSVFSIKLRFGTGKFYEPDLKIAPDYLQYAASDYFTAIEFNKALYNIGSEVDFYVTEEEFIVYANGMEENFAETMELIRRHLNHIKTEDEKIKKVYSDLKAELKISERQPSYMSGVLNAFINYGNNSPYLREVSLGEVKSMKAQRVTDALKKALQAELSINFVGNIPGERLRAVFEPESVAGNRTEKKPRVHLERKQWNQESQIFIYEDKKAVQTQAYFFISGKPFDLKMAPEIAAFNKYFGGDMSSLVFQEIREFRSLAYSTWGRYIAPSKAGQSSWFVSYIGCQSDKTNDAVNAMLDLIRNMPQKPERWTSLQSSLIQSAQSERPGFKSIIETIEGWKYRGYNQDPNIEMIANYKTMEFENVVSFWKNEISQKPITITLVGNTGAFD
ncbi:MAG TPA: hypothetical protein DEP18_04270, partial [Flavobacteriales bacterium]|nr:hypothetical protein [Flavobacteriales bacterium]